MTIHRKDGSEQGFKGYLPATNVRMHGDLKEALSMGAGLDRQRAIDAIKQSFKNRLEKYRDDDGSIVLFYESDAVATYDESPRTPTAGGPRPWKFSELQMQAVAGGTVQNALLDQPLRAPHYTQLIQADEFIPEAFDELPGVISCACHQIAAHLEIDREAVTEEMKRYYKQYYDGDFYVTPRMIFDYGAAHELSVYYYLKISWSRRGSGAGTARRCASRPWMGTAS